MPRSLPPVIRWRGFAVYPPSLQDAGSMSGVTRLQRWAKIELPLAFPHMMLGVNQTVVFALFMGNGLVLGLCVAFIGLIVDNLIRTWAKKRRVILGLD